MQDCTINVLGTEYTVEIKKYKDDEYFKKMDCNGYCSESLKQIVICDMHTYPDWECESDKVIDLQQKKTLRHELIHAFLGESGLSDNSNPTETAWARNEEMVDWFAIQFQKIYKVFAELDLL